MDSFCKGLGFKTEIESLRIPSTKNISIVSRFLRAINASEDLLQNVKSIIENTDVKLRTSDRYLNVTCF